MSVGTSASDANDVAAAVDDDDCVYFLPRLLQLVLRSSFALDHGLSDIKLTDVAFPGTLTSGLTPDEAQVSHGTPDLPPRKRGPPLPW